MRANSTPQYLALYLAFCLKVRDLCALRRVSVVSWWRSAKHNASVKGREDSRHLDGIGADLVLDQDEDQAGTIRDARALGLQVDTSGGNFHIELDPT